METLLVNGILVDGTGAPPRNASLLLRDGKVAEINPAAVPAHQIDCAGLVIAPGFIDVHTHSDYEILQGRPHKLLQGVTTEVVGNCGYSMFPMRQHAESRRAASLFEDLSPSDMRSAGDYFSAVEQAKPLVNVAALTGHSALRDDAMGMDRRAPSPAEQAEMERSLARSLDEGSIGFSTGLNCLPSSFAAFDELLALCRVLKPYGAYYTTHMRNYTFRIVQAVEEAIHLAEDAGVPVQLSHVQVVGKKCWPHLDTVLELVDAAARRGIDIGMDAYPYLAGSCALVQFLPEWCQDGGIAALLVRLEAPAERDRIARETEDSMSNTWADIIICEVEDPAQRSLLGKSIQRVGEERGVPARQAAVDLLREQNGRLYVISFNSCDENLRKVLSHPLTSICSDSFLANGLSHPRTFGTYPLFLGKYVRDYRWMSLEEAIPKTSALPARRFRLQGRGVIAPGNWADLVVFDPAAIGSPAGYASPAEPPEGIRMVFVNGRLSVESGQLTGERGGAALRFSAS